jgi:hypothetical protein
MYCYATKIRLLQVKAKSISKVLKEVEHKSLVNLLFLMDKKIKQQQAIHRNKKIMIVRLYD